MYCFGQLVPQLHCIKNEFEGDIPKFLKVLQSMIRRPPRISTIKALFLAI